MKLSAFPIFPDLTATPATPGGGIAPFSAPEGASNSPGESPAPGTLPADFATIFGGIAQSTSGGGELPKPFATGLVNDPHCASRQFASACLECDSELDTRVENDGAAMAGVAEPAVEAPHGRMDKGRASRRGPEGNLTSGVPAEQAAWAHAFATPTAFAAAPEPDCTLPLPDEFEPGHEVVEPGSTGGAGETNPDAVMFPVQPHNTPLSLSRNQVAEERRNRDGLERRGADRFSPETLTSLAPFSRAASTHVDRSAVESTRSNPMHVSRSPEISGISFSDELTLSPESGDTAPVPPLPPAITVPSGEGAGTRELKLEAGPHPGFSRRDERESPQSEVPATSKSEELDTTKVSVAPEGRQNVGSGGGRISARASHAEKLSGAATSLRRDEKLVGSSATKHFLDAGDTLFNGRGSLVGTAAAKPGIVMSPASSSYAPNVSATEAALAPAFEGGSQMMTAETSNIESTAQEAVEAIRTLAERVAKADSQSINLRFSIGESDLRVRVGYSGDEVRTTFLTESPELRAALLQEWQALSLPSADRANVRFADPVFPSSGQGEASNPSFDSASQQHRESAARRDPSSAPIEFFRPRTAEDFTTPPAPVRGSLPDSSTQRLHTFA